MAWVVDSCVLLDVALKDPGFRLPSALLLEQLRGDGLVVCPVSAIEMAPRLGRELRNVGEFLRVLGASPATGWLETDTENAAAGWSRYVRQRRAGTAGKRPLADLLIGGFACRFQGLVTRNPQHLLPFFPGLQIKQPATT